MYYLIKLKVIVVYCFAMYKTIIIAVCWNAIIVTKYASTGLKVNIFLTHSNIDTMLRQDEERGH